MPLYQRFRDMPAWKLAKDIAVGVYRITENGRLARDYAFRDQMRKASLSLSSNIAEGFECGTRKGFVRYLNIAKGSASELKSQLEIAMELGYLDASNGKPLMESLENFTRQTSAFARNLRVKGTASKAR